MKKPAHYRSALYVRGANHPIQTALASCQENYPAEHPIFTYVGDEQCIVAGHRQQNGYDLLHLVVFEGGAPAAVV